MKSILSIIAIAFSLNATASESQRPNQYICKGKAGYEVSYSTTSFIGKPQMNVTYGGTDVQAPTEPLSKSTAVGHLVTVIEKQEPTSDGIDARNTFALPVLEMRYTLIVPSLWLENSRDRKSFRTQLIRTTAKDKTEQNEFVDLECTAQIVYF